MISVGAGTGSKVDQGSNLLHALSDYNTPEKGALVLHVVLCCLCVPFHSMYAHNVCLSCLLWHSEVTHKRSCALSECCCARVGPVWISAKKKEKKVQNFVQLHVVMQFWYNARRTKEASERDTESRGAP